MHMGPQKRGAEVNSECHPKANAVTAAERLHTQPSSCLLNELYPACARGTRDKERPLNSVRWRSSYLEALFFPDDPRVFLVTALLPRKL